ncbi:MAG: hypothetical protein ABIS21_03215 [Acidimicrobiales bacterium]
MTQAHRDAKRLRSTVIGVGAALLIGLAMGTFLIVRSNNGRTFVQPDDGRTATSAPCVKGTPASKGAAAQEMIRYPWRDLDYAVEFTGPRRGVLGLTYIGRGLIRIYVRPCQSIESVATVFAHEVGHAVDDRHMTPAERGEYLAVRGISGAWFGCNGCTDYATPAGDFAEVFALGHGPAGPFRSLMRVDGGRKRQPSPEELAELERFFDPNDATTTTVATTTTASPGIVITLVPQ